MLPRYAYERGHMSQQMTSLQRTRVEVCTTRGRMSQHPIRHAGTWRSRGSPRRRQMAQWVLEYFVSLSRASVSRSLRRVV